MLRGGRSGRLGRGSSALIRYKEAMRPWPCIAIAVCLLGSIRPQDAPEVATDKGRVRGETIQVGEQSVAVFRGIPFAAPPLDALRWRPPQPVKEWDGVRTCRHFAPACPQPSELSYGLSFTEQSEDCLYLNVWSAATDAQERRPVMVWIHGGGNIIGGAASPFYDGRHLATRGVVVVTIQYRLGVFGFLAHPALTKEAKEKDGIAASGDYGLMDQIAALQWVQRNIAQFGGDAGRVTIFGESAGAVDVSLLMASPLAKGLFHRAIAESGSYNRNTPSLSEGSGLMQPAAHLTGRKVAERFDIEGEDADALEALRALSVEKLLTVPVSIGSIGSGSASDRALKIGPCVDGRVLTEAPGKVWQEGRMHLVPFIAGSNLDDGSVFSRASPIRRLGGYRLAARGLFGRDADEVLALFPAADDDAVPQAVHELITVMSFAAPARRMCRDVSAAGGRAWLYQFTQPPRRGRDGKQQVVHGAEIPFVFGTFSALGDDEARAVSDQVMQRFCAFARDGDPNPKGLEPIWPAHDAKDDRHLQLGTPLEVGSGLGREACDLFDGMARQR